MKNQNEPSKIIEECKSNVKIHPQGRYEVCLPIKSETVEFPSNKEMAWKRHKKKCERTEFTLSALNMKLFLENGKS